MELMELMVLLKHLLLVTSRVPLSAASVSATLGRIDSLPKP